MKLNIVPASQGVVWMKLGVRTFLRQPLAMSGLFFLFLAAMSIFSIVPILGSAMALAVLPGATLGFMAATQEAHAGKFPMPALLITAFRVGRERLRAILTLGALYALGFSLVLGISVLVDGGKFARLYLLGGTLTPELLQEGDFQVAALLTASLYMPLSMLFWHAPALVHWHGITPVKSLFFSFIACARNFWAFTTFSLTWMGAFMVFGIAVASITALFGSPEAVAAVMFPTALLMAAMFFTSIYFSFVDCFDTSPGDTP